MEKKLELTDEAIQELALINELRFNIFTLMNATNDNELLTTSTYILAKHSIFNRINLDYATFVSFIKKIQSGYQNVTYHNKTHAADLCQVTIHQIYVFLDI